MKYFGFTFILFLSCKGVTNNSSTPNNSHQVMENQVNFKKLLSKNYTYTLNYEIKDQQNSPVKRFTYFITVTKTNKMIRNSETIAAEKIYWKDDSTLAIIPYVEVMQQSNEVGVNPQTKEILIKLK